MSNYQATYRCRLCGGVIHDGEAKNRGLAVKAAICAIEKRNPHLVLEWPVSMHELHVCPDGSLGISDFQGFVKVEQNEAQEGK